MYITSQKYCKENAAIHGVWLQCPGLIFVVQLFSCCKQSQDKAARWGVDAGRCKNESRMVDMSAAKLRKSVIKDKL